MRFVGLTLHLFSRCALVIVALASIAANSYASPSDFELVASDGLFPTYILVEWDHVSGPVPVGYYVVHRSEDGGRYREVATRQASQNYYRDARTFPCRVYEYYVTVVWDYNTTPRSDSDQGYVRAIPDTPSAVEWESALSREGLRLVWQQSLGAAYYEIRRLEAQTGSSIASWTTSSSDYELTDVNACSPRSWYDVRACNECGCSDWSSPIQPQLIFEIPQRPTWTTPTLVLEACSIWLEWRDDPHADYYEVRSVTQPKGVYAALPTVTDPYLSVASPSTSDCEFRSDFSVRGCNCSGCGEWSVPTYVGWGGSDLPAPSNVKVDSAWSQAHGEGVILSWASVEGARFYKVFESPTVPDVANATPVWTGTQTSAGIYSSYACSPVYWIQAYCACGGGEMASIQADAAPSVSAVQNVRATDGEFPESITVSWLERAGHIRFDIFRKLEQEETYKLIAPYLTTNYYVDSSAIPCQTYSYVVRGCNSCGCGPISDPDTGFAGLPRCIPEIWLWSYNDGSPIKIEWRGCADAAWHQLVRTDLGTTKQEVIAELELPVGEEDTTHFYEDIPPKPYTQYEYSVQACNECGCRTSLPKRGRWY
ncbi:hypothetical protein ACFLSG_03460 [Candidatus Bipolaricaulota bacterium]